MREILETVDPRDRQRVREHLETRFAHNPSEAQRSVEAFARFAAVAREEDTPVSDLEELRDAGSLRVAAARIRRAVDKIAPGVVEFESIAREREISTDVSADVSTAPASDAPYTLVDCGQTLHNRSLAMTLFARRSDEATCLILCPYADFFYVELTAEFTEEVVCLVIKGIVEDFSFPELDRPYIKSAEVVFDLRIVDEFSPREHEMLKVTTAGSQVRKKLIERLDRHFGKYPAPRMFGTDGPLVEKFLADKSLAVGDTLALHKPSPLSPSLFGSCREALYCEDARRAVGEAGEGVAPLDPLLLYFDVLAVPGSPGEPIRPSRSPCAQITYRLVRGGREIREGAIRVDAERDAESDAERDNHPERDDWYPREEQALARFAMLVRAADPDALVCYGRDEENLFYLLERMKVCDVLHFAGQLSRSAGHVTTVRTKAAYFGCTTRNAVDCPGRALINLADVLKRDDKTLAGVKLLEALRHLNLDAELPDRFARVRALQTLDEAGMCTDKIWSTARVLRLTVPTYLDRGVSAHVMGKLRAECASRGYVVPRKGAQRPGGGALRGGKVLDPVPAYVREPVAVIDFNSMYPSIIRSHNLCASTLLDADRDAEWMRLNPLGHEQVGGSRFVRHTVRMGIVPSILDELARERARLKDLMQTCGTSGSLYRALNARQLACKVTMNAFYGMSGNPKMPLYRPAVANAITAKGHELLDGAVRTAGNGGEVIYGDTDSVFVKLRETDPERATAAAGEIVKDINGTLNAVMRVELECIYRPFLIVGKKRYCGGRLGDVTIKGLAAASSSRPPFSTRMMKRYLRTLMIDRDEAAAAEVVRDTAKRLMAGEFSAEELSLSNLVTKNMEEYHPCVGERVHYVWTTRRERVTDLASAAAPHFPFDLGKYFRIDVRNAMMGIMALVHGPTSAQGVLDSGNYPTSAPVADQSSILRFLVKKKNKRKRTECNEDREDV